MADISVKNEIDSDFVFPFLFFGSNNDFLLLHIIGFLYIEITSRESSSSITVFTSQSGLKHVKMLHNHMIFFLRN
jgi:hypothetical protein